MKVTRRIPSAYEPQIITITLETELEAQELYALCNWTPIVDAVQHIDMRRIRREILVNNTDKLFHVIKNRIKDHHAIGEGI